MAISDLMGQAKDHPAIVVVALFSIIVVGALGGTIYIKISEQRAGLVDERIAQLELDSRNQKKVNQIIIGQIQALRTGYENLPESLENVRSEFEYVVSLKMLEDTKRESINNLINVLANDVRQVEMALDRSEAILETFDNFINASAAEAEGEYALAAQYYEQAAVSGNPDAQYRLGTLYARGLGVDKDLSDASYWYEKAALAGNTGARAELAHLYLSGDGVQQNPVNALALYKLVERDVPLSAREKIREVSAEFSEEQLMAADELVEIYLGKEMLEVSNKSTQLTPKDGDADG